MHDHPHRPRISGANGIINTITGEALFVLFSLTKPMDNKRATHLAQNKLYAQRVQHMRNTPERIMSLCAHIRRPARNIEHLENSIKQFVHEMETRIYDTTVLVRIVSFTNNTELIRIGLCLCFISTYLCFHHPDTIQARVQSMDVQR